MEGHEMEIEKVLRVSLSEAKYYLKRKTGNSANVSVWWLYMPAESNAFCYNVIIALRRKTQPLQSATFWGHGSSFRKKGGSAALLSLRLSSPLSYFLGTYSRLLNGYLDYVSVTYYISLTTLYRCNQLVHLDLCDQIMQLSCLFNQ